MKENITKKCLPKYYGNYLSDQTTLIMAICPWFKISVSAADSAGTERDRSRRLGSDSDDTCKTLHRTAKKLWKNHDKS